MRVKKDAFYSVTKTLGVFSPLICYSLMCCSPAVKKKKKEIDFSDVNLECRNFPVSFVSLPSKRWGTQVLVYRARTVRQHSPSQRARLREHEVDIE